MFGSVPDLIAAIETYLNTNNDKPRSLIWKADAELILAKVARGRVALNQATRTGTHH